MSWVWKHGCHLEGTNKRDILYYIFSTSIKKLNTILFITFFISDSFSKKEIITQFDISYKNWTTWNPKIRYKLINLCQNIRNFQVVHKALIKQRTFCLHLNSLLYFSILWFEFLVVRHSSYPALLTMCFFYAISLLQSIVFKSHCMMYNK